MKIRTKLILWYAFVLCLSSAFMIGSVCYYELIVEKRIETPVNKQKVDEGGMQGMISYLEEIFLRYGVPSLILGLIGGIWLTRCILTPIRLLTKAAEQMTDRNLGQSLSRSGNGDELDKLTEVFNAMTDRLERSFLRIREFTLHASHELKTPLTVMRGEAETLLEDADITPNQRDYLASLVEEIWRLTIIVDGLTLLTKADAGQVTLVKECVHMDELVRDAFEDARILAQPGHLQVYLSTCEPVTLLGDRHRLRQLLLNLTDNAVKYNKPGGTVKMALRRAGASSELVIANTGEGVTPENQTRVFERFYRGAESHTQNTEGCGLGLSISQWIVHAHGGSIRLESKPDGWTTVTVTFHTQKELYLDSGSRGL